MLGRGRYLPFAFLLSLLWVVGCHKPASGSATAGASTDQAIERQLQGRWRITSYVPTTPLSVSIQQMLVAQYDQLLIEIRDGRIRPLTTAMKFERRYRLGPPTANGFTVYIFDEQGVQYVCLAQFDSAGRILFSAETAPWHGRGVLERDDSVLP